MTAHDKATDGSRSNRIESAKSNAMPYALVDRGGIAVLLIAIVVFIVPAAVWVFWGPSVAAGSSASLEIDMLVWIALLSLLLPLAQIAVHIRRFGGNTIRGNRDTYPDPTGLAGRIPRAHANLIESLVPFAAVILSLQVLGISNRVTLAASAVYLAARVVHAASYLLGITLIRSAAFYAGVGATIAAALQLARF